MTAESSPRPWRFVDPFDDGFPVVRDANERQVATLDGATPDLNEANAALIIEAVNERDRLRDIVRRLTEYADAVTCYCPPVIEVVSSEHPALTFDGAALLREARAAIGKDASP